MHAAIVRFILLMSFAPGLFCAGTATTKSALTVLMDFESPHSEASLAALTQNLQSLLNSTGFSVDVQLKSNLPENPQFEQLVVFKMKGFCSLFPRPERETYVPGPLGKAYTSDGQVLHFGEVECDRVRGMIQHLLGANPSAQNQRAFGNALAIVIAHEVYHMMGNAVQHTHSGVTKTSLSPSELLDSKLAMPSSAVSAIRHDAAANLKASKLK